jgi:hypothetical protein
VLRGALLIAVEQRLNLPYSSRLSRKYCQV